MPPQQRPPTRNQAGLAQLPHAHGGLYLAHLRGVLQELLSNENADMEPLSPQGIFLGLTEAGASTREFRFLFCCLLLLTLWREGGGV